ncbi:autotransporter outer membrane beta-barrel domain-containing protein [Morganella morganii]
MQPQAQITLINVSAGEHREKNGTRVENEGNGNIQIRLFIEANRIHDTRNFSARMDGVNISQKGTKNPGEVKVGVEGQINPYLNLWGNVDVRIGGNGYNDRPLCLYQI